jgi:hypothetical protein
MRQEVLEETIRYELLSPNVRSWLRSLVIEQLYSRDMPLAVSPETGEEE